MIRTLVLGIETSCDESAAAVLDYSGNRPRLVCEEISSQFEVHKAYGGVVPELASREHLRNLPLLLDQLLRKCGLTLDDLALIAVTCGPGLKGCLLMGISFAKGLALPAGKPLMGVNHIEAHLLAACLDNPDLRYPFLSLVVSGGHTEIHEVHGLGKYRLVARTMDDAAGEAFDKSANLLGYDYPGGAALAELADSCAGSDIRLPRVMREAEGFSFSGLKTAISLMIEKKRELLSEPAVKASLAWAVQEAIVDALVFKLRQALKACGMKRLALAGGVSANRYLRERVQALKGVDVYFPGMQHCMDNAAMVAHAAALRFAAGERSGFELEARSSWPVESMQPPAAE